MIARLVRVDCFCVGNCKTSGTQYREGCCYEYEEGSGNIFKDLEEVRASALIGELNKHWLGKIYEYPNEITRGYSKEYLKIISDIFVYVRSELLPQRRDD